ncbi:MAG: alkaline phosphatase family protein [marine benthic group bacterium]|nr:alkaline phosphatase family protein [Gemmatimonadota bacterium]
MSRSISCLLTVLASGMLPITIPLATVQAQSVTDARVLVVGIDGVRVDMLARADTPVLDSLAESGFFSDEAKTRVRTVSGPGWSSMLTGVRTAKHGVDSNDFSGNRYADWPDFLTRLEAARPELGTFAVLDWPPLGTTDSGGPLISDAIDHKLNFDGEADGYDHADSMSVVAAAEHLRSGDVHAAFVYLGDPDVVSHATDSFSDAYRASIETADTRLGLLLAALRARPGYERENWLILVSTDHGRNDAGGHGGNSPSETTIFFLAAGPSVTPHRTDCPPEIVDVAATALAHMGIVAEGLDGKPRGLGPGMCGP